ALLRLTVNEPDQFHLAAFRRLGDKAVDHAVIGIADEEGRAAEMDGGDAAVEIREAPHQRRHRLAVLAAAFDPVVKRIAEGVDGLPALARGLPVVSGADLDTEG